MNEPSQFLLYTAPDGAVKVDVFFKDETVWLTQKALAAVDSPTSFHWRSRMNELIPASSAPGGEFLFYWKSRFLPTPPPPCLSRPRMKPE
jgi:hypothetical protein